MTARLVDGKRACWSRGTLTTGADAPGFRRKEPRTRIAGMASIELGRSIDWGRTSVDYAERPAP